MAGHRFAGCEAGAVSDKPIGRRRPRLHCVRYFASWAARFIDGRRNLQIRSAIVEAVTVDEFDFDSLADRKAENYSVHPARHALSVGAFPWPMATLARVLHVAGRITLAQRPSPRSNESEIGVVDHGAHGRVWILPVANFNDRHLPTPPFLKLPPHV